MFENDWILLGLNNPNHSIDDLVFVGGISTSNTQFLDKNEYKKSKLILENPLFRNENGVFSEEKFSAYYDQQAEKWNDLQSGEFVQGRLIDLFNTAANRKNANVRPIEFDVRRGYNPDRVLKGIEGWRTVSERTMSESEIAQSQKIYNYESSEFKNETPEDAALFSNPLKFFKSFIEDPLVLAVYEEDEVDEYGVKHTKGEKKLNEFGTYYYETLGERSPIGKEVLSVADILTKEDSALNTIDFFDSDDLHKSIPGVIAKNAALVAPLFMGPIAPVYIGLLITKELTRTLPMLYNFFNLAFDIPETPEWINKVAAKAELFTTSTSTYSKENVFTFENIANLMADVALQWGLQKLIASSLNWFANDTKKLKKAEKLAKELFDQKKNTFADLASIPSAVKDLPDSWKYSRLGLHAFSNYIKPIEDAMQIRLKIGGNIALGYMALVSNTDVYSSMLEHGASKEEAAWVALGSTLGMFAVDKFMGLGELFYDDIASRNFNQARKSLITEFKEAYDKIYKEGSKEVADLGTMKRAIEFGKKAGENFVYNLKHRNLGFVGKSLGEGLEEFSEELVTDFAKSLYELAGKIGYDTQVKDVGAWDSALERYGMSFLGGTLGGGLFYGVEKVKGFNKHVDKDLVTLINEGYAPELRRVAKEMIERGEAGSTTLSGKDNVKDESGKVKTWLTTTNANESLNAYIGQRVLEHIDLLEAIIVGSGTKLSNDLKFERMVMQDARLMQYKNASYITGYYDEFNRLLNNYIEKKSELNKALGTIEGTPDGTPQGDKKLNDALKEKKEELLQILRTAVDNALQKINEFLSGDTSLEYTQKLLFALDPIMNNIYLGLDFNKWILENYPEFSVDDLDEDSEEYHKNLMSAHKAWLKHVEATMSNNLHNAFTAYKTIEKQVYPELMKQNDISPIYKKFYEIITKVFKSEDFLLDLNTLPKERTLLEGETEEEVEALLADSTKEGVARRTERLFKVIDKRRQDILKFVDNYRNILAQVDYKIDLNTLRLITTYMGVRLQEMLLEEIKVPYIVNNNLINTLPYHKILRNIKFDINGEITNLDEVKKDVEVEFLRNVQNRVNNFISRLEQKYGDGSILMLNKFDDVFVRNKNSKKWELKKGFKETSLVKSLLDTLNNLEERETILNKQNSEIIKFLEEKYPGSTYYDEINDAYIPTDNVEEYYQKKQELLKNSLELENIQELQRQLQIAIMSDVLTNSDNRYKTVTVKEALTKLLRINSDLEDRYSSYATDPLSTFLHGITDSTSTIYQNLSNESELKRFVADHLLPELTLFSVEIGKELPNALNLQALSLLNSSILEESARKELNLELTELNKYVDNVAINFQNNPLTKLFLDIKVLTHSPLEGVFNRIAEVIVDNPVNVHLVLNEAFKRYNEASTILDFKLNDTLEKQLVSATDILNQINAFVYAASTESSKGYFGYNKSINAFAREHKSELAKPWEELPELTVEYGTILQSEIRGLLTEIGTWLRLQSNSIINKTGRLSEVQSILSELQHKVLSKVKLKITVDDKTYDFPLNVSEITEFPKTLQELLQLMYETELAVHDTFQQILKESKLTAAEFFEKTKFLDLLIRGKNISKLITSQLDTKLKDSGLSDYDSVIYILSVISDNPKNYYKGLKNFVDDNSSIVPLSVLLNAARISESAHSEIFKAGIKYLGNSVAKDLTLLENCVHIDGVAGAGKTSVVLKMIKERFSNQNMLLIGPTSLQAIGLKESLGGMHAFTFAEKESESIFSKIIENWGEIEYEYNDIISKLSGVSTDKTTIEKGKFFEIQIKKGGNVRITLNKSNIKFVKNEKKLKENLFGEKTTENLPRLIFVDEAAHLSTLLIALLNEFANVVSNEMSKDNPVTVFLASDSTQSGYASKDKIVENLDSDYCFMTRAYKLKESIRSINVQKQENDAAITTLIDTFYNIFNAAEDPAKDNTLKNYYSKLPNTVKSLKFQVYIDENSINGDLTDGIEINKVIPRIPKQTIEKNLLRNTTVGYIGSNEDESYKELVNAGFKPKVLSLNPSAKNFIQGLEFDYVIIDNYEYEKDLKGYDLVLELKRLRTAVSRGKQATIFIKGISELIGKNTTTPIKSKGFNINSQVERFRPEYLTALEKINTEISKKPIISTTAPSAPVSNKSEEANKAVTTAESLNLETLSIEDLTKLQTELSEYQQDSEIDGKTKEKLDKILFKILEQILFKTNSETPPETSSEEPKKESEPTPEKSEESSDPGEEYVINLKDDEDDPIELHDSLTEEEMDRKQSLNIDTLLLDLVDNKIDQNDVSEILEVNKSDLNKRLVVESSLVFPNIGLESIKETDSRTGEERRYDTWIIPYDEWEKNPPKVLRNGEVLAYLKTTENNNPWKNGIRKLGDKKALQHTLALIQSLIIHGNSHDEVYNFEGLDSAYGFANAMENATISFEVREATNKDRFGIYNDLNNDFITIDGKNYVIAMTLRLDGLKRFAEDENEFSAIFDISFLTNHIKFLNERDENGKTNYDKALSNLNKKIKKLENERSLDPSKNSEAISNLKEFRDNMLDSFYEYSNFIENTIREMNNDGRTSYSISLNANEYEKRPWTLQRKRTVPIRVGGKMSVRDLLNFHRAYRKISGISEEEFLRLQENHRNFIDSNPDQVVSDLFIISDGHNELNNIISDSLLGKVGIFVSTNLGLTPKRLPSIWLDQKRDPDNNTGLVRLGVLNTVGIHFSELINHSILNYLSGRLPSDGKSKSKKHVEKFWRMDKLGVKMSASLWNARAALYNFETLYLEFKDKLRWDNETVNLVCALEYELYTTYYEKYGKQYPSKIFDSNNKLIPEIQSLGLKFTDGVFNSILKLNEFNNVTLKQIPLFRLGYNNRAKHDTITGIRHNFRGYVRNFNVADTGYGANDANLYVFDYESIVRHRNILNLLLDQLFDPNVEGLLTGAKMLLLKEDGSLFDKTEYIRTNDWNTGISGAKLHLVGSKPKLLKIGTKVGDKIEEEVIVPENSLFSFLPKAISRIGEKITIVLSRPEEQKKSQYLTITTVNQEGKESGFDIDIMRFFQSYDNNGAGIDKTSSDLSFLDLMDIIFHGTSVADIHDAKHTYATGAPFKYGMLADPKILVTKEAKLSDVNVSGNADGRQWTFLRCVTSPMLFTIDTYYRSGGIAFVLSEFLNRGKESQIEKLQNTEQGFDSYWSKFTQKGSNEDRLFKQGFADALGNQGNTVINLQDFNNKAKEFISEQIDYMIQSFFEDGNTTYSVNNNDEDIEEYLIELLSKKCNIGLSSSLLKSIEFTNIENQIEYTDENDNTGLIIYEEDNDGSYTLRVVPDINSKSKESISLLSLSNDDFLDDVINGLFGPIMSHREFLTTCRENNLLQESDIKALESSKTLKEYINKIEELNKLVLNSLKSEEDNGNKLPKVIMYLGEITNNNHC